MVTIGSIAVTRPDLCQKWIEQYGADRIILGADVRDGKISINGWLDNSDENLIPFLRKYISMGVKNILCTDISKDGTLKGPAIELYREIMDTFPGIYLIASGGVASNEDIAELQRNGIPAVVFGKAYYEGRIDVNKLWL